ncbi:MAG: hypothetical protein HZB39_09910 [Planctomycetes bacterium]|nr:hypothetical protein [Planctomycetota bacterium]
MARAPLGPSIALLVALAACGDDSSAPAPVAAKERVLAQESLGPVAATLTMEPVAPRFGERLRVVLEVSAEPGTALEPLELDARLGHFRIREKKDESRPERGALRYVLGVEAERSGPNIGRVPPIRFRPSSGEGAGTERELRLAPFEVEVAGLAPGEQPRLDELGALLPPIAMPFDDSTVRIAWVVGCGVLLALAGIAWWWSRRRIAIAAAEPVIDPSLEATLAIDALLAAGLVEQGRTAEFYVRLTAIVRRHVERTTGVHAPEQTTEEFLRAMDGHAAFPPERRSGLTRFLAAADLVKFAAQVPGASEVDDAVDSARALCAASPRGEEAAA